MVYHAEGTDVPCCMDQKWTETDEVGVPVDDALDGDVALVLRLLAASEGEHPLHGDLEDGHQDQDVEEDKRFDDAAMELDEVDQGDEELGREADPDAFRGR